MNVLVIDDDAEDTLLFCEALNEVFPTATCFHINTCEKIKETLDEVKPDMIFMDGHMYPTSGKECLKKLNSLVDRKQIKIIIHAGSLSPNELIDFKEIGVDDILFKAGSYPEMKANIASMIEKYNLDANLKSQDHI